MSCHPIIYRISKISPDNLLGMLRWRPNLTVFIKIRYKTDSKLPIARSIYNLPVLQLSPSQISLGFKS